MAALLTAAAVIVPCGAWYVAGSRSAAREADSIRERPLVEAQQLTGALAQRLSGRLEGLRTEESQRPFYHYQSSYHDPTSSCQCASVTPSPLATGLRDPLVKAHFQIDPFNQVTLPTLHGDDWPEIVTHQWFEEQKSLHAALDAASANCMAAVDIGPQPATSHQARLQLAESGFHIEPDDPEVQVSALEWKTIEISGRDNLVALRRVETTRGPVVQGFLLDEDAIDRFLGPSTIPVHFVSLDPADPLATRVDIDGTDWALTADAAEATQLASMNAAGVFADFRRSFAFGSIAAVIAAGVVLLLLWQTDRMAKQRARFAAAAAHELRTPLASLRLYGDMLADESLGDPEKRRAYGQKVAEEVERLGRVVSNVLGFTRLERDKIQLHLQAGNLAESVEATLERMRPALDAAGAQLSFRRSDGLPPVRFDDEAVNHLVQNLVDNAEKYSRGCEDRGIEVEVEQQNGQVRLSVGDHGRGLPELPSGQIFEPFRRGEQPGSPAGLGLGLALVRSLAVAHDATISANNRPEGGALFTVDFPTA